MFAPTGTTSGTYTESILTSGVRLPQEPVGLKVNPPFARTRAMSPTAPHTSPEPRIFRGYIRRADTTANEPYSDCKLRFMYNPSEIRRSYLTYINQHALDPTGATFGTDAMVTPPGALDFSFDMFFDREIEVSYDPALSDREATRRGVMVDLDQFDRVVRGALADPTGNDDNGIMLSFPGLITAVFGPTLSVTGKVENASVTFEKFSHRMTPTRMRIMLRIKAFHIGVPGTYQGPVADNGYEEIHRATVPYEEVDTTVSYEEQASLSWADEIANLVSSSVDNFGQAVASLSGAGGGSGSVSGITGPTGSGVLSGDQMAKLVLSAGYRGDKAAIVVAIGWRESRWNPRAHNPVGLDDSYGLFQINMLGALGPDRRRRFGISSNEALFDPATSMRSFVILSQYYMQTGQGEFDAWYINQDGSPQVAKYDLVNLQECRELVRRNGGYS